MRAAVRAPIAALLCSGVLPASGCGTIDNQWGYWRPDPPADPESGYLGRVLVYGGVREDVLVVAWTHGLSILDVPFCLAADTALLPFTIPEQIAGPPRTRARPPAAEGRKPGPPLTPTAGTPPGPDTVRPEGATSADPR